MDIDEPLPRPETRDDWFQIWNCRLSAFVAEGRMSPDRKRCVLALLSRVRDLKDR